MDVCAHQSTRMGARGGAVNDTKRAGEEPRDARRTSWFALWRCPRIDTAAEGKQAQPYTVVAQGRTVAERRAAGPVQSVVDRLVDTAAAAAAGDRLGDTAAADTTVVVVAAAVGRRRVVGHTAAVVAPDRTVAHTGLDRADS
jgi:hypothetical protein